MPFEHAREAAPGVYQVDTGYLRPGLNACYVVRGQTAAAVVDTGHAAAVPRILATIDAAGIQRGQVRHVVATHVHLDHAGGVGALMRALPEARLVVHQRGARHMVDPTKLWAGTVAVYGAEATQALYGDPVPVAAERVDEAFEGMVLDLGGRPLRFMDAPGHARHHVVVHDEATRGLFTGDCFGLSYRETDGAAGPFFFPTTTPSQFDPPTLHATIDRMLALRPERVYLTHFGAVAGDVARHGAALHRGLDQVVALARAVPAGPGRRAALKQGLAALLLEGLAAHGSPASRETALAVYDNDLTLNAQGLEIWLEGEAQG
jgi:glyoxylase-like metal-dependent hydrolase (beta-lactamase superfamily II)